MSGTTPPTTVLPNVHLASVPDDKLTDYLLDPNHPERKADFFIRFGFQPSGWRRLRDVLKEHPTLNPVVNISQTGYGTKYEVQCTIPSPDGRNPCIRSFWIINIGASVPKLLTAYARP